MDAPRNIRSKWLFDSILILGNDKNENEKRNKIKIISILLKSKVKEERENKMHKNKLNWFLLGVPPFYRESQRNKHHYRLSSISSHNATNSPIL